MHTIWSIVLTLLRIEGISQEMVNFKIVNFKFSSGKNKLKLLKYMYIRVYICHRITVLGPESQNRYLKKKKIHDFFTYVDVLQHFMNSLARIFSITCSGMLTYGKDEL